MKPYRKELWFKTPGRRPFLNITSQVEAALKESGVQEGRTRQCNAHHRIRTTRGGCTPTTRPSSKGSRRTNRLRATAITKPERTTPMPT